MACIRGTIEWATDRCAINNNALRHILVVIKSFKKMRERVAREIKTTFASKYHKHISLEQALQPDIIRSYAAQSTGEKHLITPHKD